MHCRIRLLTAPAKPSKDYSKIQSAAKAEKQQKILETWVSLHRGNNYVRIDESMHGCPGMKKWLEQN
jgi:hypothetical protein